MEMILETRSECVDVPIGVELEGTTMFALWNDDFKTVWLPRFTDRPSVLRVKMPCILMGHWFDNGAYLLTRQNPDCDDPVRIKVNNLMV